MFSGLAYRFCGFVSVLPHLPWFKGVPGSVTYPSLYRDRRPAPRFSTSFVRQPRIWQRMSAGPAQTCKIVHGSEILSMRSSKSNLWKGTQCMYRSSTFRTPNTQPDGRIIPTGWIHAVVSCLAGSYAVLFSCCITVYSD